MIRFFESTDLDQITGIFNEVVETGEYFFTEFPLTAEQMRERLSTPERETVVLEDDGAILGFYYMNPLFEGRSNHVANCAYAVSKSARGKKVGSRLAEFSIEHARKKGYKSISFVAVVATNEVANHLWQKLGFRMVGTMKKSHRNKDGSFVDTNIYQLEL
ncbi:MAG TPA: GNAT family N-acetyltransferase [Cyclobacteriaceae bacterium]|jgi:L-amino acid N-acyltransferase YncA